MGKSLREERHFGSPKVNQEEKIRVRKRDDCSRKADVEGRMGKAELHA
jgi:hypothetical protein